MQNQEDSSIVNRASVERGLMNGSFYRSEKAELDKGEVFGNPDYTKTTDIKKSANYGFVENGFVREGTIVKSGDVLIVKTGTIAQPTDDYQYVDKSIIYKQMDQAIVERVIVTFNNEDKNIAKVKLRAPRNLGVGDKLCLTPDHEVLVKGRGFIPIAQVTRTDLVYTIDNKFRGHYEQPSAVHLYPHNGPVIKSQYAVMTPEHKVPVAVNHGLVMLPAGALVDQSHLGFSGGSCVTTAPVDYATSRKLAAMVAYGEAIGTRVTVDPTAVSKWLVGEHGRVINDGRTEYTGELAELAMDLTNQLTRVPDILDSRAVIEVFFEASKTIVVEGKIADDLYVHIAHLGFNAELIDSRLTLVTDTAIPMGRFLPATYQGTVHCVTVSSGMFLVRHHGKLHVTGNSSRNGNKAIVAAMWPVEDMPYDENGVTPDIIINPHGLPSRMVVGQLIETLEAMYAVNEGVFVESSPFRDIDIKHVMGILEKKYGIKYGGHKRLFNGKTGNWLDTLIFMGPVGYQRLQKFVVDESYAVATGPSSSLERQPLDGRSNEGGLRLGEMECWVLASHGAMRAMSHKLYEHSDGIELFVCRTCGQRAIVNEKLGIFKCKSCKSAADVCAVSSSWCASTLLHELAAMNIGVDLEVDPYTYTKDMESKK